jgi:glycosyltransferase involved in cell wall biosynthesis
VAGFWERKGHLDLVEAIARLPRDVREHLFVILAGAGGDGDYLARIREEVSRCDVGSCFGIFEGVSQAELAWLYSASDLFVLPSREETFPFVLLEAMYAGLPVVSTRVGAVPEMVTHGVNGFLCEPRQPEHLAACIANLATRRDLRLSIGATNRISVSAFSWKHVAARTIQVYDQLLLASRVI